MSAVRYAVICKGLPLPRVEEECRRLGARNVKPAPLMGQLFCDLEEQAARRLAAAPGVAVKPVGKVKADVWAPADIEVPQPHIPEGRYYSAGYLAAAAGYERLRRLFRPELTGAGSTIVVLDTGIRKTHQALQGKVVYEANFSDSETADDVFDHGTGVAYVATGSIVGGVSGVAPGAVLWNIKVLNDRGEGSEEDVVQGLEHVMQLRKEALDRELPLRDPMRPSILNMSFGAPDDGDPDNPLRAAARQCTRLGMGPIAAAGNGGPSAGSILSPACDPMVVAVGALTLDPFDVWRYSSRGPTIEGLTKPDFVCFGVNVLLASAEGDTAYKVKSGTSFAAPILGGIAALAIELPSRLRQFTPEADCIALVVSSTLKPQGVAAAKDDSYGYGMPWGEALARVFRPGGVPLIEDLEPALNALLAAGMVSAGLGAMVNGNA